MRGNLEGWQLNFLYYFEVVINLYFKENVIIVKKMIKNKVNWVNE